MYNKFFIATLIIFVHHCLPASQNDDVNLLAQNLSSASLYEHLQPAQDVDIHPNYCTSSKTYPYKTQYGSIRERLLKDFILQDGRNITHIYQGGNCLDCKADEASFTLVEVIEISNNKQIKTTTHYNEDKSIQYIAEINLTHQKTIVENYTKPSVFNQHKNVVQFRREFDHEHNETKKIEFPV